MLKQNNERRYFRKWRQQRSTKRRHMQGLLDETDPLNSGHCYVVVVCQMTRYKKVLL